jgi:hypothetical protein
MIGTSHHPNGMAHDGEHLGPDVYWLILKLPWSRYKTPGIPESKTGEEYANKAHANAPAADGELH